MIIVKIIFFFILTIQIYSNDDIVLNYINLNFKSDDLRAFFDLTDKEKISSDDCNEVIDSLKHLLERYVYLDILRNPPQTSGNSFEQIDLISELNNYVCSIDNNLYDFYRKIKKIIDKAKDLHLSFKFNINHKFQAINSYFFISPISFKISGGKVYASPSKYISNFDNNLRTQIEQKKDLDISLIRSSNGNLSPINYIILFNNGFLNLKSEQAQFINNLYESEIISPNDYPFEYSDLSNIIITYSDSSILSYNYKVLLKTTNNFLFYKFINQNFNKHRINFDLYKITRQFLIKNQLYKNLNQDNWNYIEEKQLGCKVDNDNKVDVIYQSSFDLDIDKSVKFLKDCFNLFDDNTYPIVVIEDYNGGGYLEIANYLTEYINLNKNNRIYSVYRNNQDVKDFVATYYKFINLDTCEKEDNDKIFNSNIEIDYGIDPYGNKIRHKITKMFDSSVYDRDVFYQFRKKAKNIRKPTEIIIFTDGYSYSATSNFIKETQLRGGAIIVGYGGNPNLKTFDASQSPSTVINTFDKNNYNDLYGQNIENLGFTLSYTVIESFNLYNNILYPLEFEINEIDERVELYNKYDDTYYTTFITEANKIFEKYKLKCNPKNKNLVLISEKCIFEEKYTHGGYECGENGIWSDKCVPSFCDIGYFFDRNEKKCVKDVCYKEKNFFTKKRLIYLIFLIIFGILGLAFLIRYIKRYFCDNKNGNCCILISAILFLVLFIVFSLLYPLAKKKYYL